MVAAAALAYVVKERSYIEQFGIAQSPSNAGRDGEALGVISAHKAPRIGDHFSGVRIDCIGMEKVKLHLPDNGAEGR